MSEDKLIHKLSLVASAYTDVAIPTEEQMKDYSDKYGNDLYNFLSTEKSV